MIIDKYKNIAGEQYKQYLKGNGTINFELELRNKAENANNGLFEVGVNKKLHPTNEQFQNAKTLLVDMAEAIVERTLNSDLEYDFKEILINYASLIDIYLGANLNSNSSDKETAGTYLYEPMLNNASAEMMNYVYAYADIAGLLSGAEKRQIKNALETFRAYLSENKADKPNQKISTQIQANFINISAKNIDLGQQYLEQLLENENRLESNKNATNNSDKIVQEVLKKDSKQAKSTISSEHSEAGKQAKSAVSSERSEVAIESKKSAQSAKNTSAENVKIS